MVDVPGPSRVAPPAPRPDVDPELLEAEIGRLVERWARPDGPLPPSPSHSHSHSRRDGYKPLAEVQVREFLQHVLLGYSVKLLALRRDRAASSVYQSIRRGKALAHGGFLADLARGLPSPFRGHAPSPSPSPSGSPSDAA
jgi:hypothetical protein